MKLSYIDWSLVLLLLILLITSVLLTKKYVRSVSDFLAAGRTGGRYVISLSQGMAMLGAITIVGMLEMNFVAGFVLRWWEMTTAVVIVGISVSGWVLYRFRQTRVLTMAQFFEIRYSRKFRIFSGILAFSSGIINFGIFPSVGARFFIYYCGLPPEVTVIGLELSTYALLMFLLLSLSLYFVFSGGQIAVIFSDFVQGIFLNIVFVLIVFFLLMNIEWNTIEEGLASAPANASLLNPFNASEVEDFNFWYFLIGIVGLIYGKLSWQGVQAYHASAKSAHEAKMGEVLGNWRMIPQWGLFLVIVPVIAYVVMNHSSFADIAGKVNSALTTVDNEPIKTQLTVPLVLTHLLPEGLLGAFAAVILGAFITTHDTYLHSWGSIFIQDIIMPFRNKSIPKDQHLKLLKISIVGVAVFIFFFSLLFQQSEYIFLFFAITGAIFAGGSGAVIIGGLYWKKGTTLAAWCAMIIGSTIAVGGIVIHQLVDDFFVNGQVFWAIAMGVSSLTYILISLIQNENFEMDKLLHRGKYKLDEESYVVNENPSKLIKFFGMGKEFTRGDKWIYALTYAWTFGWFIVFLIGTIINIHYEFDDGQWSSFWQIFIWIQLIISVIVVIWFSIGGIFDLRKMFHLLKIIRRDDNDDGYVY